MFRIFKNKKLFKDFVSDIREHRCGIEEARTRLKELPIKVVRDIGKEVIFSDYDGFNYNSKHQSLCYFDNLDRWQKEFYIEQRLYKLCR